MYKLFKPIDIFNAKIELVLLFSNLLLYKKTEKIENHIILSWWRCQIIVIYLHFWTEKNQF